MWIVLRPLQDALRISNLNESYLALVAHTAADDYAIAEISGLTGHAAAQAARQSIRQISLAAAALVLPEPTAR